jgi:hypothetical protein
MVRRDPTRSGSRFGELEDRFEPDNPTSQEA